MQELNQFEVQEVSGGVEPVTTALVVIGMVGACLAWAYSVGKDMAERDNAAAH